MESADKHRVHQLALCCLIGILHCINSSISSFVHPLCKTYLVSFLQRQRCKLNGLFLPPSLLQSNVLSDILVYSNHSGDTQTLGCSPPCFRTGFSVLLSALAAVVHRWKPFIKHGTTINDAAASAPLAVGTSCAIALGAEESQRGQGLLWVILAKQVSTGQYEVSE